jgi:hypothetical protein
MRGGVRVPEAHPEQAGSSHPLATCWSGWSPGPWISESGVTISKTEMRGVSQEGARACLKSHSRSRVAPCPQANLFSERPGYLWVRKAAFWHTAWPGGLMTLINVMDNY